MELTIKEYDERLEYSQKNRSKVRKDLVKQSIDEDYHAGHYTKLYRWQTVYLRKDYELSSTEVCVYAHIYGFDGCYESEETIAENICSTRKSVGKAITSLINKGLIFSEDDVEYNNNGIAHKIRWLYINKNISSLYDWCIDYE